MSRGYVHSNWNKPEHTQVVEKALGVPVLQGYVVHHKDGNVKNNCIENLEVMTRGEHTKLHCGVSGEPDRHGHVLVHCPECNKDMLIEYANTKRPTFTGLCKSCAARLHGKIRQQEGGTPCQNQ